MVLQSEVNVCPLKLSLTREGSVCLRSFVLVQSLFIWVVQPKMRNSSGKMEILSCRTWFSYFLSHTWGGCWSLLVLQHRPSCWDTIKYKKMSFTTKFSWPTKLISSAYCQSVFQESVSKSRYRYWYLHFFFFLTVPSPTHQLSCYPSDLI